MRIYDYKLLPDFKLFNLIAIFTYMLLFASGCSFYDCGWIYKLEGKIVDNDNSGVCNVHVSYLAPIYIEQEKKNVSFQYFLTKTDNTGSFSLDYGGNDMKWGYQKLFGVFELPPVGNPVPPLLDSMRLYIKIPSQEWKSIDIDCASFKQEYIELGIRRVDLGYIAIH